MTFARVAAQSGLTYSELAQLYGVSRQALHYWRTKAPPRVGSHTARMAETVTKALNIAIDRKILPLREMNKTARAAWITRMAVGLQNSKLAPLKDQ